MLESEPDPSPPPPEDPREIDTVDLPFDPSSRGRRIARRAALEFGYLLFLLILLEVTLRLGGFLFMLTRGGVSHEASLDPADIRILAIGESTTFGLGVAPEEAYPTRLEQLLREETGRETTVYNVGVPGQTSVSILRTIDQQMWKYRPDLVLCLFGINDTNEALNDLSARRLFGFRAPDFLATLRIYRLACLVRDYAVHAPKVEDHGAWVFFDPEQRRENRDWVMNFDYLPELESNYGEILEVIRAHRAAPVMMSYLATPPELLLALRRIAKEENVAFIDLNRSEEEREGLLNADRFHPNAEGHEAMARAILEAIPAEALKRADLN